jgi:hypothetical protein
MKLTEISFKPIAHIKVTAEEIALMCECADKHYDGKDATRQGNILCTMRNCEANVPGYAHSLTFRELDLLAKILEVGPMDKAKIAFGLSLEIRNVLIALNDATPSAQKFADETKIPGSIDPGI